MSLEIIVSENSATKNGRETYIGAKKSNTNRQKTCAVFAKLQTKITEDS